MFAFKPKIEVVFRVLLIAAILFGAPSNPFSVRAADVTVTPSEQVTETPTAEPTTEPTQTDVPIATGTPIAVTETPTPSVTPVPSDTASSTPSQNQATASPTSEPPHLVLSADPSFITPSGIFTLNWTIQGLGVDGLTLQIVLPAGVSLHGNNVGTYDEASHTLLVNVTA